ncbi:stressosome-associated protein Prli42 [Paenibacillus thailandensis]|uniref:Stressosome-associated protein Prli42 n=1 Tax=Paenibacillus thailandensis TaxID=393250 RepID=A0ABW5R035_9BACL
MNTQKLVRIVSIVIVAAIVITTVVSGISAFL